MPEARAPLGIQETWALEPAPGSQSKQPLLCQMHGVPALTTTPTLSEDTSVSCSMISRHFPFLKLEVEKQEEGTGGQRRS